MASTQTSARVESTSNRIVLNFDSLDDAMRLLSPWRGAGARAGAAAQIHDALEAAGLDMEVRVNGHPIVALGNHGMTGPLLRLLGHVV